MRTIDEALYENRRSNPARRGVLMLTFNGKHVTDCLGRNSLHSHHLPAPAQTRDNAWRLPALTGRSIRELQPAISVFNFIAGTRRQNYSNMHGRLPHG